MTAKFNAIGLIGKPNHLGANQTLKALHHYLKQRGYRVIIETLVAAELDIVDSESMDVDALGNHVDLAIVVGGDGNMLGAARILSQHDVAVIGVNRGNLGFLTDLDPDEFEEPLHQVLQGNFQTEYRNDVEGLSLHFLLIFYGLFLLLFPTQSEYLYYPNYSNSSDIVLPFRTKLK